MVEEQNIHNAVIFVSRHRGAPIGDYPFKSLEEADIIYFKLGPAPRWRLTNSDWKAVYAEYFVNSGREAYLYEPGQNELKLLSLEP